MVRKTYHSIIIDDEKDARDVLTDLLKNFSEIKLLDIAADGIEGLKLIKYYNPEIAFVDIDMPRKNGIELLKDLHNTEIGTKVIFTTAYEEYALKSIQYHPFAYLLKPISIDKLEEVINHLKSDEEAQNDKHDFLENKLKITSHKEVRLIPYQDITYMIADGNYTKIGLMMSNDVSVSLQLGKIEQKLPSDYFLRISRGVLINLNYLVKFKRRDRKVFLQSDGQEINFDVSVRKMSVLASILG